MREALGHSMAAPIGLRPTRLARDAEGRQIASGTFHLKTFVERKVCEGLHIRAIFSHVAAQANRRRTKLCLVSMREALG